MSISSIVSQLSLLSLRDMQGGAGRSLAQKTTVIAEGERLLMLGLL